MGSPTSPSSSLPSGSRRLPPVVKVEKKSKNNSGFFSRFKKAKVYHPRTISLQAEGLQTRSLVFFYINICLVLDKEKKKFFANVIINQKYNVFTFIPIVLFEQVSDF